MIQTPPTSKEPPSNTNTTTPSHVLHRSLHHTPHAVTSASGLYLHLSNGQRILDATGGAAVSCLGHGNTCVKNAIAKQMDVVSYCHSLFYSTNVAEELAEELCKGTGGEMTRVFVVSSGSEAIEASMKLARQYYLELSPPQKGRYKFIARKESYHGTTLGALSMGGHVARRSLYEPMLLDNISRVSYCNAYRGVNDGESEADYVARLAQELDDEFVKQGPESVCAFVAEPVVGAALGCVPAVAGYFKAIKSICDKHGALLIFDEIMSGMGRSGTLHAWQQEGVVPDIQAVGKGLGGGYAPVAGLLINKRVVDVLERGSGAFSHGQTYQGHPIACAAALEVQRIIREEGLVDNVRVMGGLLGRLLGERLGGHECVGDVRGKGLFWGIEFVKDKATKEPFDTREAIAMGVHEKGMEEKYGISLYPGTGSVDGKYGDHIIISPAYTVTEQDIKLIVDKAVAVIEDFFAERRV
ncbi:PLP-dependent transferase [Tothia fuscella]|uniref:PLP-dependent transferase n=1 Tax=Tothia fuscella TaxID=1048955 RepID=A0A9P4NU50_9PEZI|nr:PLP-dependent transferase [Tothia fuscella]